MKEFTKIIKCPKCKSAIKNYRDKTTLRRVCSKNCEGYKVIEEFELSELAK